MRNRSIFDEIDNTYTRRNDREEIINPTTHARHIRNYLTRDPSLLEKIDRFGRTPLQAAIGMNDPVALKVILRFHPNLNIVDYAHFLGPVTPLMMAAINKDSQMLRMLVNAGADINFRLHRRNVIDVLDEYIEDLINENERINVKPFIKNKEYLLKAKHSARVIQGNFRNYITKKKLNAANVIKKNYLSYAYAPGGPAYNRAKKHFETAFGVRRRRNNPRLIRNSTIFEEIENANRNDIGEIINPSTHARHIRNYIVRDRSVLEPTPGLGKTPLIVAILLNDHVAVKVILAFHPDLNTIYQHFTFGPITPLIAASILENNQILRMLINAGADISVRLNGRNVIDILNYVIENHGNAGRNVNQFIKNRDYLLKANDSANIIQGRYKNMINNRKTKLKQLGYEMSYMPPGAIHPNFPGGQGYYEAKKHFESAFGRKRKVRKLRKLPKALIRMAKKYKVKLSIKRGNKRIYKSINVIKRQIRQKKNKMKK
jgi:ankyrin repeat protein